MDDSVLPEFAWVGGLSPRHMRLFAVELSAALAGANPERVASLLESWEATAELDMAPELHVQIERNRARQFTAVDEWLTQRRTA